jgi:UDP-N-acetylglucosamine transferase subunit ALG13
MSSARAVVTHAGVGSILLARACGKLPIVMPRMSEHGEAVDNHQVTFARRLEELDMLVVVEAQAELERAIAEASGTGFAHRRDDGAAAMLTHELRAFLTEQPAFASNGAANPDTVPREPSRIRAA